MYYDMSGFDYGILDVVQVLHLRKRRGNYYDCPFCGETHGKLNINVEKNVFRCNRCDASGGMLKLYADLHNVTLSEANQQIREALGKGEYRTDYIKATPVQEEKATAELAPIEEIHRTYQRMLSMLTLNRKHQEDLQRRGLKVQLYYWWIYLLAIAVTLCTVYLSLMKPMRMAAKVSEIEAIGNFIHMAVRTGYVWYCKYSVRTKYIEPAVSD